jgi:pimeloyl-ACP methyl ester carboxylesterase
MRSLILSILALFVSAGVLVERAGAGNFNLPVKTFGGKQLWADQKVLNDWRIQQSVATGHFRLLDPNDVRRAWGTLEAVEASWEEQREAIGKKSRVSLRVLLLHGLGRSRDSFSGLKGALQDRGFDVEVIQYPSTRLSLEDHARQVGSVIKDWQAEEVVIVTHSLGGLVTRKMIELELDWRSKIKLKSIIMIAPPNKGAAISDYLQKFSIFGAVMGEAGLETRTVEAEKLPVPDVPFGVIAGGKGDARGYNPLLDGDDDGVVRVEETSLPGQKEFLLVDAIHSFIMNDPKTVEAVISFIEEERF